MIYYTGTSRECLQKSWSSVASSFCHSSGLDQFWGCSQSQKIVINVDVDFLLGGCTRGLGRRGLWTFHSAGVWNQKHPNYWQCMTWPKILTWANSSCDICPYKCLHQSIPKILGKKRSSLWRVPVRNKSRRRPNPRSHADCSTSVICLWTAGHSNVIALLGFWCYWGNF